MFKVFENCVRRYNGSGAFGKDSLKLNCIQQTGQVVLSLILVERSD